MHAIDSPISTPKQPNPPHLINHVSGNTPDVFTQIYRDEINIAVLQRELIPSVKNYCEQLIDARPKLNIRSAISIDTVQETLTKVLPKLDQQVEFVRDLSLLVEMYAYLFELEEVGVRMQVLDRAMCPRFHTDKVGCRLVTTYHGSGTEWLHNVDVDRSKLGAGSLGLKDEESGLYSSTTSIEQVKAGDVVLLKGDGWIDNDQGGAVHRSPAVAENEKRVIVTMDFA